MQFLFIDSNLFLQCRPLRELNWDRFVGREELTLLVPSAVLSELDKHKSDGNSRRAQRARKALQFLDSILNSPDDTVIIRTTPARVIAQFAPEVSGDMSTSNDDSILFEVAEMARTGGEQSVGLVTHDTNLKVKAKRKNLRFFPVPNEWLLEPEPDEREKRIKRLEEDIALLKRQTPIMEIRLDGNKEIELVIPSYEPLTPETIDRLVKAMTTKFSMKTDFSLSSLERLRATANATGVFRLHPPADWEIEKYQNEKYPEWEKYLRDQLEQFHFSLRAKDATTNRRLLVANNGTVPSEHVQIAIKVSNGLLIVDSEQHHQLQERLSKCPRVPSPPQPREISMYGLDNLHQHQITVPTSWYRPTTSIHKERDEFYLKIAQDTEVVWECENMRHESLPQEFMFRVGVPAQSLPSGGKVVITVSAENLPKAVVGDFRIKITNVPADTERAANEWLGLNDG